jgi:hypothetical protein
VGGLRRIGQIDFCPKLFNTMQGETRPRWRGLCAQAETEEDPEKLIDIFRDIIAMLDEKAARLFAKQMREEIGSKPNQGIRLLRQAASIYVPTLPRTASTPCHRRPPPIRMRGRRIGRFDLPTTNDQGPTTTHQGPMTVEAPVS